MPSWAATRAAWRATRSTDRTIPEDLDDVCRRHGFDKSEFIRYSWPSRSAHRRPRTVHRRPSPTAIRVDDAMVLKPAFGATCTRSSRRAVWDIARCSRAPSRSPNQACLNRSSQLTFSGPCGPWVDLGDVVLAPGRVDLALYLAWGALDRKWSTSVRKTCQAGSWARRTWLRLSSRTSRLLGMSRETSRACDSGTRRSPRE